MTTLKRREDGKRFFEEKNLEEKIAA